MYRYAMISPLIEFNMKTVLKNLLVAVFLFIASQASAQNIDTYIKFTSPTLVGPTNFGGKTGLFQLTGFEYQLKNNKGKILPGSMKFSVYETSAMPQIWSVLLNTDPVDFEIYQFTTINSTAVIFRTFKVKNSFINAIKYNTEEQMASSQQLEVWLGQMAFEYKVFSSTGTMVSTHTTGWDFINNVNYTF
jgi:hypothetical protein